uniref:Uncharacterized protein n=1 Tax=Rhizophora mucronata TaxID=61149 RepID=A0A2P2Q5D2_RHIMU
MLEFCFDNFLIILHHAVVRALEIPQNI